MICSPSCTGAFASLSSAALNSLYLICTLTGSVASETSNSSFIRGGNSSSFSGGFEKSGFARFEDDISEEDPPAGARLTGPELRECVEGCLGTGASLSVFTTVIGGEDLGSFMVHEERRHPVKGDYQSGLLGR